MGATSCEISVQPRWRRRDLAAALAGLALLLLAPAVYNGFPLIFPDTDTYLHVAYGNSWTVERTGFYGLAIKPAAMPFSGAAGPWLATAIQCLVVAAVLVAAGHRIAPRARPVQLTLVLGAVALLTSLPWHAAQLMPDAFTGALILMVWLAASRDAGAPGTALLWLAVAFVALSHLTHAGIAAAAGLACIAAAGKAGAASREIGRRLIALTLVIAAVIGANTAVNGALAGRWTPAPMGSWFLFARLYEDGPAQRWLQRHCGRDAAPELCAIRSRLPNDSQAILWWDRSPLSAETMILAPRPVLWRRMKALDQAAMGSIREEPGAFLLATVGSTARQLVAFAAIDDQCPLQCSSPQTIAARPAVASPLRDSRQLRDALPKRLVRTVTGLAQWLGVALLLPFLAFAWRRRDWESVALLLTVLAGLIANAAITGGLSDVQPRYQSRVAWLAPFSLALIALRWRLPRSRS